jgi:dCTP deaminase
MSVLVDWEIKKLGLITPCVDKVKCALSYGLEPASYTITLDDEWRMPIRRYRVLDPLNKEESERSFKTLKKDVFTLSAGSFVLAKSKEYINIPKDVVAIALTKSTYARLGILQI